jgi:hypothetical protein
MAATHDGRAPSGRWPRHRRQRKPGGKGFDWHGCQHASVKMKFVGMPLGPVIVAQWPASDGIGAAQKRSATAQKQAPRALKWWPQ